MKTKHKKKDLEISLVAFLRGIISLSIIFVTTVEAKIIRVPADSATIQGGINGAVDGDTVFVAPGVYGENINFSGKGILIASNYIFDANPSTIESTIIYGLGPKVTFDSGEDSTSVIIGFTIRGSISFPGNRGVVCLGSSPIIANNIIQDNIVAYMWYEVGAGIYCDYSDPVISQNVIKGNVAFIGGGIYLANSSHTIIDGNLIEYNGTISGLGIGGGAGIDCSNNSSPVIRNNLIIWNRVDYGAGGGICCDSAIITNNTLSENGAGDGGGIACGSAVIANNIIANTRGGEGISCSWNSRPTISYNNFWANFHGDFSGCDSLLGIIDTVNANGDSCDFYFNIFCNSYFCHPDMDNYYLAENSCCVCAGENGKNIGVFGIGCPPVSVEEPQHESILPQEYALSQNYPNPFNPTTLIKYDLPVNCQVMLEVYNILGQKVSTLVDGDQKAGYKVARWDATDFASGIYFYRLKADDFTSTRKMILLR